MTGKTGKRRESVCGRYPSVRWWKSYVAASLYARIGRVGALVAKMCDHSARIMHRKFLDINGRTTTFVGKPAPVRMDKDGNALKYKKI